MADHATVAARHTVQYLIHSLHDSGLLEIKETVRENWERQFTAFTQRVIDAAVAEKAEKVQGLVDAAEKAAKARDLDEIDGVLLDLDKALSTFRAGKPIPPTPLPAEVVEFPQATEEERRSGWSLGCRFLRGVRQRASKEFGVSLEEVEAVLLAGQAALLAKYTTEEQDDETP